MGWLLKVSKVSDDVLDSSKKRTKLGILSTFSTSFVFW